MSLLFFFSPTHCSQRSNTVDLELTQATLYCSALSIAYVGSLY